MRIQILSDLHFEFHRDFGESFVDSLNPDGIDVLVLAGDICAYNQLKHTLDMFSAKYKNIIYTPGNHEYYKSSFKHINNELKSYSNINVLNPGTVVIDGIKFVGATMWFAEHFSHVSMRNNINDFTFIADSKELYEINREHVRYLQNNVDSDSVVVTHHLPSNRCVSPRFIGSPLNTFFVCEMDQLIMDERPKLWIHGHTHDAIDLMIGDTRVIANPLGYPREINQGFKTECVVEL